jgi:ribosome-associated translation inhibitor RaiA
MLLTRIAKVDLQIDCGALTPKRTNEPAKRAGRWAAPHLRSLKSLASGNHATIQRGTDWHTKINTNAGGLNMQIAPEITFEGSESSDAARAQILGELERLETHNHRITGCRVKVIAPSHKHRHGTGFQVHIWLTLPRHENIVVDNSASDDARREHAEVAIREAFAAARRQVDALAARN